MSGLPGEATQVSKFPEESLSFLNLSQLCRKHPDLCLAMSPRFGQSLA